jgi:cytochrome P450
MALLLNNPVVLKKAATEIDAVVGTSRLLQESDLAGLRCIITETLRLYPLAPHLVPHEASRDITVAGGHAVARGTMVLVDVYSMQRDPDTWDDPEKFVPERFMAAKNDRWMMPFGMALGVLIQCFEWERVGHEEVDMSEGSGLTMPMVVPLVASMDPILKALDLKVF